MEDLRKYRLLGTPDCPIEAYCTTRRKRHRTFTHWHPELEVMFVEEGSTVFQMNGQILTLHPNDILIIPPNTVHSQKAYTPELIIWNMIISPEAITMPKTHVFQKEFLEPLQQDRLVLPTVLHPGDPAHTVLLPHVQRLKTCLIYTSNYKMNRFSVAMAICTALPPFCHTLDSQASAGRQKHRAVRECMRYIHSNYPQHLTIASLAEHVHLQPNYLCTLFKEHTGQTIIEHLTRIRIDAASSLLRDSDLPIEVIAEKTGFRSQALFFRHFRKITGTTPRTYRGQQARSIR